MPRAAVAFLAILVLSLAVVASTGGDSSRSAAEPTVTTTPLHVGHATDPTPQLVAYLDAIERQQVGEYLHARVVADVAIYLASIRPPAPTQPQYQAPAPRPSGGTGACGGATNGADRYIMRESGGNPNAYNPSGAWGCYQIMPGTWAGAGCDELGQHGSASAEAQAQCASRLPDSAWAL